MGKTADTIYKVSDTIEIHPLPDIATIQDKIEHQNPDILLANSNLEVLFQTKKEINTEKAYNDHADTNFKSLIHQVGLCQ